VRFDSIRLASRVWPLIIVPACATNPRRARRAPPPPATAHTRRCAAGRDRRLRSGARGSPSHTQLHPASQAAHPTACAGLCGTHTQRAPHLWRASGTGDRRTAARETLLCSGCTGLSPRDPACSQPTTAWHTLRRTLPPETHARTRARRPRRGVQHKHEPSLPTIQRRPRTLDDS